MFQRYSTPDSLFDATDRTFLTTRKRFDLNISIESFTGGRLTLFRRWRYPIGELSTNDLFWIRRRPFDMMTPGGADDEAGIWEYKTDITDTLTQIISEMNRVVPESDLDPIAGTECVSAVLTRIANAIDAHWDITVCETDLDNFVDQWKTGGTGPTGDVCIGAILRDIYMVSSCGEAPSGPEVCPSTGLYYRYRISGYADGDFGCETCDYAYNAALLWSGDYTTLTPSATCRWIASSWYSPQWVSDGYLDYTRDGGTHSRRIDLYGLDPFSSSTNSILWLNATTRAWYLRIGCEKVTGGERDPQVIWYGYHRGALPDSEAFTRISGSVLTSAVALVGQDYYP